MSADVDESRYADVLRRSGCDKLAEELLLRDETPLNKEYDEGGTENTLTVVQLLFRGINNPLALRKRYRDLIKIFHPDNLFGDGELAGQINKEYLKRKQEERFW